MLSERQWGPCEFARNIPGHGREWRDERILWSSSARPEMLRCCEKSGRGCDRSSHLGDKLAARHGETSRVAISADDEGRKPGSGCCKSCGARLAVDQRYCVACGERCGAI